MNLYDPTLTMQVLADENILTIIMENVDDPQTLFNLVIVLPTAKAIFERFPRQILTATLSGLPLELEQLAILYISLIQDQQTRASKVVLLEDYLRPDYNSRFLVAAGYLRIPKDLSNPFETLRKLAAVCNAVEDLLSGFVDRSIKFIDNCQAVHAAGLGQTKHYELGHKLQPLSTLWNHAVTSSELFRYSRKDKPQPWSLPLRASEIYRVKRALWRLEIFAALSHEPHTFPKDYPTDTIETWDMPQDYDEGMRLLLERLQGFELAELESVYDYLWCETIEKVYQHMIDARVAHYDQEFRQAQAERKARAISNDIEQWEQDHAELAARVRKDRKVEKARHNHRCYLKYYMSLGLPFLHRVRQQITRDGGEINPENYPPLRYRSPIALRDILGVIYFSRHDNIWLSYSLRSALWQDLGADPKTSNPNSCALYLEETLAYFRVEDVWRAGCYMWEREDKGSLCDHEGKEKGRSNKHTVN